LKRTKCQTDPNTEHVKKALNSLEFLVVQEIFMNESWY
jgi:predicted molibdopterin-dependent oxidoreductase YjgC